MNALILLAALSASPYDIDLIDTGLARQAYTSLPYERWGAGKGEWDFVDSSGVIRDKVLIFNGTSQPNLIPAVLFWAPDSAGVFEPFDPPLGFYRQLLSYGQPHTILLDPIDGARLNLTINGYDGQEWPLYNLVYPIPTEIRIFGQHSIGQPEGYVHFYVTPEPDAWLLLAIGFLTSMLIARRGVR